MTLSTLTIGQRVALGFSVLLFLGAVLGTYASVKMLTSASGARFLSEVVVPQADVSSELAQAYALAQRAARTYALTGDADQLAIAEKHLAEVHTTLDATRKQSENRPALATLHTVVIEADKALANYETQFKATVANLQGLARIRAQLDAAAAEFVRIEDAFMKDQHEQFSGEIAANLPAEKLEERRRKIKMGGEITAASNHVRIAAFKAQALHRPDLIEQSLPLFDDIEALRQQLLSITRDAANQQRLASIGRAASAYRDGVEAIVKNYAEAKTIGAARIAADTVFDSVIGNVMSHSIKNTLEYATTSSHQLGTASQAVIAGLITMVVVSVIAALLIIRGVNRALISTAGSLSEGSLQVAAASSQVSSSSQTLAEGSSEQAASLEEISSSIEELSSMTKRNAENAQAGKTSAAQARLAAEAGAAEMERMQAAMNAIQQSSNDISKIIKTIDEIAFQTNILALNAAVEAARAGEAGSGFAVVADEVRSLAQRSAVAARETADKIADATARSAQGVELSVRVSAGLQQILEKSREVDRLVTEVATASNEQSEGIAQINTAVSQMDRVTQSNAAGAEETAAAAEQLNAQSVELRNVSSQLAALVGLKLGDGNHPPVKAPKAAETPVHRADRSKGVDHVAAPNLSHAHAGGGKLSFHD